jgi:hypothetical protein
MNSKKIRKFPTFVKGARRIFGSKAISSKEYNQKYDFQTKVWTPVRTGVQTLVWMNGTFFSGNRLKRWSLLFLDNSIIFPQLPKINFHFNRFHQQYTV